VSISGLKKSPANRLTPHTILLKSPSDLQKHLQSQMTHKQLGYDLMAAAFEVYNTLGSGFLEEVYQEAMEIELTSRNIPFLSKPKLELEYKGHLLKKRYEPDLLIDHEIVGGIEGRQ